MISSIVTSDYGGSVAHSLDLLRFFWVELLGCTLYIANWSTFCLLGLFNTPFTHNFSICLYLPWKPPKGSGQLIIHTPPQITTLQLPLPVTKAELLTWPHNPLTPMSDWHLISPHSITLEWNAKVMRIQEMITNLKSSRMLNIFSLSAPQEMYRKQYGEYPYWC